MNDSQAIMAGAARSAFSGQSQHNRLLRLDFPRHDGPPAVLLVNRLEAHEELSRSFRFKVEVLSDDARIPLKVMMARMVTISLVRADGSLRYFNGHVTEFRFVRTDGGFAFYEMILEPWMAFTRLRKDSVSFHGKSVREITEETLQHFQQSDWHMHIFEEDPRLTVANQHNETDFNHLHRRWEALGLHYWYEHRADGHTLMLSDMSLLAERIDVTRYDDADVIPFRSQSGADEADGIHAWSAVRQLGSGSTTLASFDYKNPAPQRATWESSNAQGDFYPYDIYENAGEYGFRFRHDGEQVAQKAMEAHDKTTQYFEAAGNDRTVQPGRVFKLGDHFSAESRSMDYDPEPRGTIGHRDYLIVAVRHEASNNYQAGSRAPSEYKNA
ncbi:MAG: type VI secretion system Vgr family protein, partial [Pseudomonadota bacterium]|nr:type VI secretion system Vgr family protein [Pseudomonadota bacterium]